ncbi:MAG: riboflavin biosynthesis protein RibF [Paludibacteraceae bacterium]|nr:riboflavin biosynthesis protein RibF [Paludibacteraceae bacterium]
MSKIATIGFFDGVHRGHRFLFAQLHEHAKHHQLTPAIYTFDRHPKELLAGQAPAMLTTHDERKSLLQNYGEVHFLDFSSVQHLTAEQFMRHLHDEQDVAALLIGYDHHFGSDRLKGFAEYEKIARKIGMHVERAYECLVDGIPVSSSRIRKLMAAAQIDQVNRLLGYTYGVSGVVEHGNAIGAKLGFPTANIRLNSAKQLPASGVYAVEVHLQAQQSSSNAIFERSDLQGVPRRSTPYKGVANIGTNPTVGNDHLSLEVHLLDFQGDLYGQSLSISFLHFLREEKKFASLDELKKQITEDIREAIR